MMAPSSSLRATASVVAAAAARRAFAAEASAASAAASHRPVLQLHGLHARYANAAYVAASKAGQLDRVESELLALYESSRSSPAFAALLDNPLISRGDKAAYVGGLDRLHPATRNLLATMAGNARLSELPKVAAAYASLMKARRGQVDAKVISAEPLTAPQLKDVEQAVSGQVPEGKTVLLEAVVDPTIVGGLQVQIGDQFLDLSVRSRIEEIAKMPLD
jgi:F-type H+-transporting ATPase subunit O